MLFSRVQRLAWLGKETVQTTEIQAQATATAVVHQSTTEKPGSDPAGEEHNKTRRTQENTTMKASLTLTLQARWTVFLTVVTLMGMATSAQSCAPSPR